LKLRVFHLHGVLPYNFSTNVLRVLHDKSGDSSDVNDYRAISIPTAMSKLIEATLFESINSNMPLVDYQFGFKQSHSTAICTEVFKRVTDYYTDRGSYFFACFVYFSKAFDRVNYWKLFHMLLDDGVDKQIVRLLSYWYSSQEICVRWKSCASTFFTMGNGTR
jgi:Reverse transcriptase (RNA-dependent DNA polymerase)